MSASTPAPRISPGDVTEIGRVNMTIARLIGAATGGGPPNVFTTLARHRRLFRPWLRFAGALMPGGVLPRADTELVILRVAHNGGCDYEWHHHERLAIVAGMASDDVARVRTGPGAEGWSERQRLLLRAADELHAERVISDELWDSLRTMLSETELIELLMLIGHYEMLAMTLVTLRVPADRLPDRPPSQFARLLQGLAARRARS